MDKMKNGAVLRNGTQRTAKEVFEKYAIVIAFLALLIVVSILCSSFLTPSNLILVLNQTSINGILAVGITYVLITAGIDISIGSVVGLSGVISAMVVKAGAPLPVGFLCGILAGTLVGVIIGILVTKGKMSGILVAPGFGNRGIEGKIEAVRFARENNIPFLGICLGMQCAVIEFARHVLNLADANSSEMEQTPHPVIDLMEEQKGVTAKGGTMRLGAYPCALKKGSKVAAAYGKLNISERHRHRYEFNNDYLEQFEAAGMKAVGVNPDTNLVEVVEIENHPWFIGTQYHPEYKSTVLSPSPLFVAFVKAALAYAEKK